MNRLHDAQDIIIDGVQKSIDGVILCGGTALSRCYLKHRVSYDLDFFVNHRFNIEYLTHQLKMNKIVIQDIITREDIGVAKQIHGISEQNGQIVKISFIEDTLVDMFDKNDVMVGNLNIHTECLDGLMHRKLRTISGVGIDQNGKTVGARQTARDLFDLFFLSKRHEFIPDFIKKAA